MNKRFSTLLATALVAGSLSASAQLVTVGSAAAGATSGGTAATFVPGEYYYLKGTEAGITAGSAEYLAYLKGKVTTDSLAVVDDVTLTTSEATDRALWKVVEVKNPATGALSTGHLKTSTREHYWLMVLLTHLNGLQVYLQLLLQQS
ncbi:hypothetical protein DW083_12600 [Parabacteroides sp. AF48-14]|uniref:hypothetical protein n=1 Tax=Parabacteroides sp. AF48-14 TaxID=2292052 RepID=UPI000FF4F794|nr:hypothetical protein [Parabacteroides sp. AF48-14]RHO70914.1 hypothetical protein DW083_12600 [Parabacteroides sp. AF48-14]